MTNEKKVEEETTSVPEEEVAAPAEEPKTEEAPAEAAPAEEAKCSKCGGALDDTGKCPVCDVETQTEAQAQA